MVKIALGEGICYRQEDLRQQGWALEFRLYAEDPGRNFAPSIGRIESLTLPQGPGVRLDLGIYEGFDVPIHYDPMISKLVIWARTRAEAIERMSRALFEYKITGVKTSIKFLERIMECPDFKEGKYDTHFIQNNEDFLMADDNAKSRFEDLAIVAAFLNYQEKLKNTPGNNQASSETKWKDFGRRSAMHRANKN